MGFFAAFHAKIFLAHPRANWKFLGTGAISRTIRSRTGASGSREFAMYLAARGIAPGGIQNSLAAPELRRF